MVEGFTACPPMFGGFKVDGLVKSPKTVMPDLIPADHGICDRHPEVIGFTGFRPFGPELKAEGLSPE